MLNPRDKVANAKVDAEDRVKQLERMVGNFDPSVGMISAGPMQGSQELGIRAALKSLRDEMKQNQELKNLEARITQAESSFKEKFKPKPKPESHLKSKPVAAASPSDDSAASVADKSKDAKKDKVIPEVKDEKIADQLNAFLKRAKEFKGKLDAWKKSAETETRVGLVGRLLTRIDPAIATLESESESPVAKANAASIISSSYSELVSGLGGEKVVNKGRGLTSTLKGIVSNKTSIVETAKDFGNLASLYEPIGNYLFKVAQLAALSG